MPLYARAIDALRDGGDRELLLALETMRLSALILLAGEDSGFKHEADRFRDLPGDTPAECALLGLRGPRTVFAGAPAADVADVRAAGRRVTLDARAGTERARCVVRRRRGVWLPEGKGLYGAC